MQFAERSRAIGSIVVCFVATAALTVVIARVAHHRWRHHHGHHHSQVFDLPRCHERIEPRNRSTTLTLAGGRQHLARIIDISRSGVALTVDAVPPIGAPVTVGARPAQVVRLFEGGIALEFNRLIPEEMFDENLRP